MKFKDNDFINLDYSDIKDEVSENIRKSTENKTKIKSYRGVNLRKALSYALCVMLTCVVSVGSTLLIQGSVLNGGAGNDGLDGSISPTKAVWVIDENFDEFYIFSGDRDMVDMDIVLKTNIISEKDKNALKEYCSGNGRSKKYFNVYMGVKDNRDIVVFHDISSKPYERLVFESNLSYSFKSVVEKFEEMSGEKLTQEFLKESRWDEYYDSQIGEIISSVNDTGGISMRFSLWVTEGFVGRYLIEYYTAIINGQIYVVTCRQLNN